MQIDFATVSPRDASKLLLSTIVPRPIALVTTIDLAGNRNAAPFSFFNCMSTTPPILVLGLENRGAGTVKDTAANLRDTGEFVVHLVDEALAEAMNIMATDFGPEVDELSEAGVETAPCIAIRPPRIVQAPVAFECRQVNQIDLGDGRCIAVGEVLQMHIRDSLLDPARMHVDTAALALVSRLQNPGWYGRTTDRFQLRRYSVESWRAAAAARSGTE